MAKYSLLELLVEDDTKIKDLKEKIEKISKDNLTDRFIKSFVYVGLRWDGVIWGEIKFHVRDSIKDEDFKKIVSDIKKLNPNLKIVEESNYYELADDREYYPVIKFEIKEENKVNENLTNEDEIRDTLADYGREEEINQYLDSLEFTGDKFDNMDDYVEDFQLYLADKSL